VKLKHLYFALMVPGAVLPVLLVSQYFSETGGVDIPGFVVNIFTVSKASAAAATDLFLSGGVFLIFVVAEGLRLKMRRLWIYFIVTPFVGVSFALPLFLYLRERQLETAGAR
jgi:hypothetical protein